MLDDQAYLNKSLGALTLAKLPFAPADLSALADLVATGKINTKQAKEVLDDMVAKGLKPAASVALHGFEQVTDSNALEAWVDQVLAANQQSVTDWHGGKDRALGYLVGQVMKASQGKANPGKAKELILGRIGPMGARPDGKK